MKHFMTVTNNEVLTFEPGVSVQYVVKDAKGDYDITLITGRVKFADGSEWQAVLGIDELSSGEHCETYIMFRGALLEPSNEKHRMKMGKTHEQVYPYKYNYRPIVLDDIHVDEDTGWSG